MRLLESLLLLEVGGAGNQGITTQRLSYRSLGIEQIGNVYESLLDHTVVRADDIVLGLHGKRGLEPKFPSGESKRQQNEAKAISSNSSKKKRRSNLHKSNGFSKKVCPTMILDGVRLLVRTKEQLRELNDMPA